MTRMIPRLATNTGTLLVVTSLALIAAACGGSEAKHTPTPTASLQIVTTLPVLADFAGRVGGEDAEIRTLVPSGGDVHSFQWTPRDSMVIGEARLIVVNGGGIDNFLRPSIDVARSDGAIVVEAAQVLISSETHSTHREEDNGHHHDHDNQDIDPHFWLDPLYAITYVEQIRDGLIAADAGNADRYQRNADQFLAELRALHDELTSTLSSVPSDRRILVSFHDAFGHFGARYGFEVLAFVGSHGGALTPSSVIEVMEAVRYRGINAVFAEPQLSRDVLERVATDAGIEVGEIRSETFDLVAPNYKEMMRANARSIVKLLGVAD